MEKQHVVKYGSIANVATIILTRFYLFLKYIVQSEAKSNNWKTKCKNDQLSKSFIASWILYDEYTQRVGHSLAIAAALLPQMFDKLFRTIIDIAENLVYTPYEIIQLSIDVIFSTAILPKQRAILLMVLGTLWP